MGFLLLKNTPIADFIQQNIPIDHLSADFITKHTTENRVSVMTPYNKVPTPLRDS
tara:strand:+ start:46 stop:210 length:165 start_codon:yes stop_codon:yes gene_type:complete